MATYYHPSEVPYTAARCAANTRNGLHEIDLGAYDGSRLDVCYHCGNAIRAISGHWIDDQLIIEEEPF